MPMATESEYFKSSPCGRGPRTGGRPTTLRRSADTSRTCGCGARWSKASMAGGAPEVRDRPGQLRELREVASAGPRDSVRPQANTAGGLHTGSYSRAARAGGMIALRLRNAKLGRAIFDNTGSGRARSQTPNTRTARLIFSGVRHLPARHAPQGRTAQEATPFEEGRARTAPMGDWGGVSDGHPRSRSGHHHPGVHRSIRAAPHGRTIRPMPGTSGGVRSEPILHRKPTRCRVRMASNGKHVDQAQNGCPTRRPHLGVSLASPVILALRARALIDRWIHGQIYRDAELSR